MYADRERVINVKTGWADPSRRIWHFSEDAALKEGAIILQNGSFLFSRSRQYFGQQNYKLSRLWLGGILNLSNSLHQLQLYMSKDRQANTHQQ